MATKRALIYWDSCVFISCIEQTPGRYGLLRDVLRDAESGHVVLVASTMVIAEVVKLNSPSQSDAEQADRIRDFFENDYIQVRSVDRRTAEEAASICRTHGLKPPDAIHVATALRWGCKCLQTYDGEKGDTRKLLAFDGKIGWPVLAIELPKRQDAGAQRKLFNADQSLPPTE